MILLAQGSAMCGSDAVPTAASQPRPATVVQRDDSFVIVAPDTLERSATPAPLTLGRAVRIDAALLVTGGRQGGSAPR